MPKEIFFSPVVDSTQLEAQRLLQDSYRMRPAGPLFHVATGHQTAGRGRFSRTWQDCPNTCSLTSTVVKVPVEALENAHWLTIIAALSVTETVVDFYPQLESSLQLKWPNDVLLQGSKLGGALATVLQLPDPAYAYVSLGVGVNLSQSQAALPTADAISLLSAGMPMVPAARDFNERFLTILRCNLERFDQAGWDGSVFRSRYDRLLVGVGQPVLVTHLLPEAKGSAAGETTDELVAAPGATAAAPAVAADTYEAVFVGVSEQGWACVQPVSRPGAVVEISSADITFASATSKEAR